MAVGRIPGVARKAARHTERLALSWIRSNVGTLKGSRMATTCPVDFDTARLRREIRAIYARVASDPISEFHFHRGPAYAAERLGYDATALAALPPEATASFAGVANPLRMAALPAGATVVDIGCGAGMDLMLAAGAGFLLAATVQLALLAGGSSGFVGGNASTFSLWLGLGVGLIAIGVVRGPEMTDEPSQVTA